MNNYIFIKKTPVELMQDISIRIKKIRKRKKISQIKMSEKSGVSYGSVKRFETTGEISLLSLIKIAVALGIEDELEGLFTNVPFKSIEEIVNED